MRKPDVLGILLVLAGYLPFQALTMGSGQPALPAPRNASGGRHIDNAVTLREWPNTQATHVAISHDGKRIACGDAEGHLSLYDDAGRVLLALRAYDGHITALAISNDESLIATAGPERMVRSDGSPFRPLEFGPVQNPPWVVTGEGVRNARRRASRPPILSSGHEFWAIPVGSLVKLWDGRSGRLLRFWGGGTDPIYHISLSDDGKLLLAMSPLKLDLTIWDAENGKPLLTHRFDGPPPGAGSLIRTAPFAPSRSRGVLLASLHPENVGGVLLWDFPARTLRRLIPADGVMPRSLIAISPDGRHFVISRSNNGMITYNFDTMAKTGEKSVPIDDAAHLSYLDYSPDGSRIVTADEHGIVRIWDTSGGLRSTRESPVRDRFKTIMGPSQLVRAAAFLPTGLRAVSGGFDTLRPETQPDRKWGRIEPTMVWDVPID